MAGFSNSFQGVGVSVWVFAGVVATGFGTTGCSPRANDIVISTNGGAPAFDGGVNGQPSAAGYDGHSAAVGGWQARGGNGEPPLVFVPAKLDFGTLKQGTKAMKPARVCNTGNKAQSVYEQALAQHPTDALSVQGSLVGELAPSTCRSAIVSCESTTAGVAIKGQLIASFGAQGLAAVLPITCASVARPPKSSDSGTPDTTDPSNDKTKDDKTNDDKTNDDKSGKAPDKGPVAKPVVKEGTDVIPQTMLHLKGSDSKAATKCPIKKYHWTVQQPVGSQQVFVPGPNFPNPTFTANVAGKYVFCLTVWDCNGKASAPVCSTLMVLPEEDIHVELVWKTPADWDETDTGPAAGSDLDLHFAHPIASPSGGPKLGPNASKPDADCDGSQDPWFSNPYDTFWFNPDPNWGSANPAVQDDPSLDLDDTDGAGPENLNLASPEGTKAQPVAYDIGVHYWNDHGFGVSYATVNVYLLGVLALQISKVLLKPLDMWHVGRINWPNTMSQGALDPFQICYQSGDPCKGGKRWQPKGEHCIKSCYVHPAFTASTTSAAKPSGCKNQP